MKVKEPLLKSHSNAMIPHLRSYIVEKVEKEKDTAVLQQLYAVITPKANETFAEKFTQAKEQTERYCTPEIAEELEDEGYMIGKPYPFNDEEFDLERAIKEDELDQVAPDEWVEKMFPEINVKG